MPIKIEYKTEKEVRDIPMTGLVSYSDVIDETYRLLKKNNLELKAQSFRPSANGDTLMASFVVDLEDGSDLKACINWSHSYHKAVRFQCNVSAETPDGIYIIREPVKVSKGRRSSNASIYKQEIMDLLSIETKFIQSAFQKIVEFKDNLKETKANLGAGSVSLGLLYVEENILTTSQASIIKEKLMSSKIETAWDMYKCFGEGLKESHPKVVMGDHIHLYDFFQEVFLPENKDSQPEKLSLPGQLKTVDEEIKEQYNFVSPLPSVTFL